MVRPRPGGTFQRNAWPDEILKFRWASSYPDQLSEGVLESTLASAASFKRSALLMYLFFFTGASLALAFLALALNNCFSFF